MENATTYNYAFLGLGASNSLLILQLNELGLLKNKTLAIIEPDHKLSNDKTFCFWATPPEVEQMGMSELVDYQWTSLQVAGMKPSSLNGLIYYHVSSINLYEKIKQIINDLGSSVNWVKEPASEVTINDEKIFQIKTTNQSTLEATYLFDSRPTKWKDKKPNQAFLWQSFFGWKIKTEDHHFDPVVFNMMDFDVPQSGNTQFVYTLPNSPQTALVELTRFGVNPLEEKESDQLLEAYLKNKGISKYTIEEKEKGRIPMSTLDVDAQNISDRHVLLGGAAGKVKPSTGYAFKSMCFDAIQIAENLRKKHDIDFQRDDTKRKGRFAFYDRLLLKILEETPQKGKGIFEALFNRVDATRVLKFLEEKTSVREDIQVLASLPKWPFIRQAFKDIYASFTTNIRVFIPLLASLFFILFDWLDLQFLSYTFLVLGLVLVGIPHGAMDHILLQGKGVKPTFSLGFILSYLLKGAMMFFIWWLSPDVGLWLFILYSAWHFGQADFEEWGISSKGGAFIWGFWLLTFILTTHLIETNAVILQIGANTIPVMSGLLLESLWMEITGVLAIILLFILGKSKMLLSMIMLMISMKLPLLLAFGLFFVFQHSVHGWLHIQSRFQESHFKLAQWAAPFSFGALAIFFAFFFQGEQFWNEQVGVFFIFLSCLSFPHVWEMHRFYRYKGF
ncbi:beta-carotene 15,15'-dioxygenase, Brp/Blh family [Bacteroidia bacterium]|nr:beta-carotene 15,15'-dioxygenase, Brp/Blh family [Bacteroidia bacterium]